MRKNSLLKMYALYDITVVVNVVVLAVVFCSSLWSERRYQHEGPL